MEIPAAEMTIAARGVLTSFLDGSRHLGGGSATREATKVCWSEARSTVKVLRIDECGVVSFGRYLGFVGAIFVDDTESEVVVKVEVDNIRNVMS